MSPSGTSFNRRSLIVGGLALPLVTTAVSVQTMGIALADGTDAPSNGETKIVDTKLKDKKSVTPNNTQNRSALSNNSNSAKQVSGFATMAAATWTGEDPDVVEIQGQALNGTWGEWIEAELLTEDGDKATDAVWIGESKAVNVRAFRNGADVTSELTAHLIATSPAANDLGGGGSQAGSTARGAFVSASVKAGTHAPSMFSRREWGANESWARDSSRSDSLRSVIVHHTAGSNSYSKAQSPQVVRGIYSYHTQTLKWADVGYNVLVDKYGQIFEGRRGGLENHRTGAHAYAFNHGSFGISVMGNYESTSVSSAALNAVAALAAWKLSGCFVNSVHDKVTYTNIAPNPQLQRSGNVTVSRLIGHRDVNRTACPGQSFYNQFSNLRTLVATRMSQANADHKRAFTAGGGAGTYGTVTHIERTIGSFRVTRLTKGIVLTYAGSTRAYQTSFAFWWQTSWGRPLHSTTSSTQRFEKGVARRVNGKVTFTPQASNQRFIDVDSSHPFYKEIDTLAKKGILRGWPDDTFRPQETVLRDAVIAFLYRVAGQPAFTPPAKSPFLDVPTSNVFYKEITWAHANGLADGWKVSGGYVFRPFKPVLRDSMAAFMARAAKANLKNVQFNGFKDVNSSLVFEKEIKWMGQTGISRGWPDGTYRPFSTTKRAELAAFLYRDMEIRGLL